MIKDRLKIFCRKTREGHLVFVFVTLCLISSSPGQVLKTQKEALQQAFPESTAIARKVVFLTDKEVDEIQDLAKAKVESKIVSYYVASKADSVIGYAFFETTLVRTKMATFMVVVAPDSTVEAVEILAFYEPYDYLPTAKWLALFEKKSLNANLWPKRDIHQITGATLTVQSITFGVRKVLATFQIAVKKEMGK